MESYLTAKEAAEYLKLAERTLVRLAHEGKIPGVKIGGQWRFRRALLDEYLEVISVAPGDYPADGAYDVTIFDGMAPTLAPGTGHVLYLNPLEGTLPFKVGAMLFFSLPFVFGAAREANPGRRVTLGAIVGISYYYFDQAPGYTGLLLGIHTAFTTLLPLAIIVLIAFWLLFRVP